MSVTMTLATMPMRIVMTSEMFCLPGRMRRPRAPMMAPTMMAPMMVPIM